MIHIKYFSQSVSTRLCPYAIKRFTGLWQLSLLLLLLICHVRVHSQIPDKKTPAAKHIDVPYVQDYSIKYKVADADIELYKVCADRNGVIKIFSSKGLLQPYGGEMLYPGSIVSDRTYRPISAKKIASIGLYKEQFVFGDDKAILSNAWAGA